MGKLNHREAKTHIGVVNSHPIQYFSPLYRFLNACKRFKIDVLYYSNVGIRETRDPGFGVEIKWDIDLLDGFSSKFVGKSFDTAKPGGFWSLRTLAIWREIRAGNFDAVVIHGNMYFSDVIAFCAAKFSRTPCIMHCETHGLLFRPFWKRRLRRFLLGKYYGAFDAILAIGTANSDFYKSIGIDHEKIFLFPYTVDNERFSQVRQNRPQARKRLKDFGLQTDRLTIVYASKFIGRKYPIDVVSAAASLRDRGLPVQLLMIGTGPELETVKQAALDSDVPAFFYGFANQSELPELMSAGDVFALPSENEPWGLIVNEAMNVGLPVVVGRDVGCVPDLVIDDETGATCIAGDPATLADAIERIGANSDELRRFSENASRHIAAWNYDLCSRGLGAAVDFIRRRRGAESR